MERAISLRNAYAAGACSVRDNQGRTFRLRTILESDAAGLMRCYDAMSEDSKWFRMLSNVPHLSAQVAARFCAPDPDRDICVVIEGRDEFASEILGGARITGETRTEAEFSVSLRTAAQSSGLGFAALRAVLLAAQEMGYLRVWGVMAPQNSKMIALARKLGFEQVAHDGGTGMLRFELDLEKFEEAAPEAATSRHPAAALQVLNRHNRSRRTLSP